MTLGQMLIEARQNQLVDLETLILFLVFEKKVQTLQDEKKCLDRYLLPKHTKRMNELLIDYKTRKGITYQPNLYSIIPQKKQNMQIYVIAYTEDQAEAFIKSKGTTVKEVRYWMKDDLVKVNHEGTKAKVNIKDYKQIPQVIGVGG